MLLLYLSHTPILPCSLTAFRSHAFEVGNAVGMRGTRWSLAPVVSLFLRPFPSAIFRGIRPVVINTPKRVPIGPGAKIGVEVLERVDPSVADRNAPASVGREFRIVGIQTALLHARPRVVFQRVAHVVGAVIRRLALWVSHRAATTLGMSVLQLVSAYKGFGAAITETSVHGSAFGNAVGVPHDEKLPKALVGVVAGLGAGHRPSISHIRGEFS